MPCAHQYQGLTRKYALYSTLVIVLSFVEVKHDLDAVWLTQQITSNVNGGKTVDYEPLYARAVEIRGIPQLKLT